MEKEVPQHTNQPLPRNWNKALLPRYEVIAVDERDPDYPDQIVISPIELPQYPKRHELINDPHYVRFLRLSLEGAFINSSFYWPDHIQSAHEGSAEFGRILQHTIDSIESEPDKNRNPDHQFGHKLLAAIYADYCYDPNGALHRLN